MSKGDSGQFSGTKGTLNEHEADATSRKQGTPLFSSTGHVSERSISANRELFYGKSVNEIDDMLKGHGYVTRVRKSTHNTSTAQIIVTDNSDKHRNITQVQVSEGSSRHGNVPYVKISTNNAGKFKVINAAKSEYQSDGRETAKLFFRRKSK